MNLQTLEFKESDIELYAVVTCPWCGVMVELAESVLGRLGRIEHCRCRYCGGIFSHKTED